MPEKISERKLNYANNIINKLESHDTLLFANIDHVGSKQFQTIRKELSGDATIIMGRNVSFTFTSKIYI